MQFIDKIKYADREENTSAHVHQINFGDIEQS